MWKYSHLVRLKCLQENIWDESGKGNHCCSMRKGGKAHTYSKNVEKWQNAQNDFPLGDVQVFFPPVNKRKLLQLCIISFHPSTFISDLLLHLFLMSCPLTDTCPKEVGTLITSTSPNFPCSNNPSQNIQQQSLLHIVEMSYLRGACGVSNKVEWRSR